MIIKDDLFQTGNREKVWDKYCGFLDLSLPDFMEIQEQMLEKQLDIVRTSKLAGKFMPYHPGNIAEFRDAVPLTTYDDYAGFLMEKNEDALAVKPYCWARSTGRCGCKKWVPYTERAIEMFGIVGVASMILACANNRGEVNIGSKVKMLLNLPPAPYVIGLLADIMVPCLDARVIAPAIGYAEDDYESKLQAGFATAMRTGVDVLSCLATMLITTGDRLVENPGVMSFGWKALYPHVMWRLMKAWVSSRREGRAILPRDLWPLEGLCCYGIGGCVYREKLKYYWGRDPLQSYGSAETGMIAINAWNKKHLTFMPSSCFLEFIPEGEWLRGRENPRYKPQTVLFDEVEPGRRYELVITSFHGMPFLRYRMGDLIKVMALEDREAGIRLPQVDFETRIADIIDIAGSTRLDEETIWKAIANTGVKYEDWSARAETEDGRDVLRLYIELKSETALGELNRGIRRELKALARDYIDAEDGQDIPPLHLYPVSRGSFRRYYEEKRKEGADLAWLRPPHMNAPDDVISQLVRISQGSKAEINA